MPNHPQIHVLLRVMHNQACWATWAWISLHKNAHGSKYTIFLVLKAGIWGPYEWPRCKTVLRYYPSRQFEERLLLILCARFKIHCPSYFAQYCVKARGLRPTHGSVSFNINILSSHSLNLSFILLNQLYNSSFGRFASEVRTVALNSSAVLQPEPSIFLCTSTALLPLPGLQATFPHPKNLDTCLRTVFCWRSAFLPL